MEENFQERRKHARLHLALPMYLQWVNKDGIVANENCNSLNVSAGGVYYKSQEGLPLDTDTMVVFNLPLNDLVNFRILRTRGKVIRVEQPETDKNKKGIALKFLGELKFSAIYND
ncbi:MAG: PilZ domain-containing protein [Candidatus Ratteibacteria bacterium]|nr:PilZ domain-containing protein [Candidatus Ratteibacteria bacterium]